MIEFIAENLAPIMFVSLIVFLLLGYPVAFSLAAGGLLFFIIGMELAPLSDSINLSWPLLNAIHRPGSRGDVERDVLAVPFFTFMGIVLENPAWRRTCSTPSASSSARSAAVSPMPSSSSALCPAATTGVVAASVIAMGLISLPIMLRYTGVSRFPGAVSHARHTEAHDWSASPLGPPESWPQSLRTTSACPPRNGPDHALGPRLCRALQRRLRANDRQQASAARLAARAQESWTELRDDLEPLLRSVRDTGETVFAKDRRFHINRHGYDETVWFDISFSAVPDESGGVGGVLCIVSETTDRVEADRRVRESEARFHAMADLIDQMIWSTLPDGHHDYYNRRWYDYTGVPEGSTDGDAWNGMFHLEDQDRACGRLAELPGDGQPYHIEYRLRHRSGDYRWVLGRAQPVRDESGAVSTDPIFSPSGRTIATVQRKLESGTIALWSTAGRRAAVGRAGHRGLLQPRRATASRARPTIQFTCCAWTTISPPPRWRPARPRRCLRWPLAPTVRCSARWWAVSSRSGCGRSAAHPDAARPAQRRWIRRGQLVWARRRAAERWLLARRCGSCAPGARRRRRHALRGRLAEPYRL